MSSSDCGLVDGKLKRRAKSGLSYVCYKEQEKHKICSASRFHVNPNDASRPDGTVFDVTCVSANDDGGQMETKLFSMEVD
jgi:hypothetical protein